MTSRSSVSLLFFMAAVAPAYSEQVTAPASKPAAPGNSSDVVIAGQILKDDAPDKLRNRPSKVHALRLEKDKVYVAEVTGDGISPTVHLEDSTGTLLIQGMNLGNNLSRLRITASKDDVFLFYVASNNGGEGKYSLSVKHFIAAAIKLIPLATPVANKPTEIQGTLAVDDPPNQYRDFPGKVHTVDLKAGKTYVIDLMSAQFDTYLLLQNANAAMIAQDDDGGGNLNSRLRFQPPVNGSYRIVATTFNGQVGPYTLRVTEQPK